MELNLKIYIFFSNFNENNIKQVFTFHIRQNLMEQLKQLISKYKVLFMILFIQQKIKKNLIRMIFY